MQSSFDGEVYPVTEEDLFLPDEAEEYLSHLEVLEQKREKFERRRLIKDIRR